MLEQRCGTISHLAVTRMLRSACNDYDTMVNKLFTPLGLTFAQSEILLHLYQLEPDTVETRKILQIIPITPSALSGTIKKLRQKGYVEYTNGNDRRSKQIRLTAKGLEIQEHIMEVFQQLEDEFFSQISDEECESIEVILRKITQHTRRIQQGQDR